MDKELKDDPAYVKWVVRVVNRVDGKEVEKFLTYHKCQASDYDTFAPPSDGALYTLN